MTCGQRGECLVLIGSCFVGACPHPEAGEAIFERRFAVADDGEGNVGVAAPLCCVCWGGNNGPKPRRKASQGAMGEGANEWSKTTREWE